MGEGCAFCDTRAGRLERLPGTYELATHQHQDGGAGMTKTPVINPLKAGVRGPARRELVDDIIDNLAVSWKQYGPNVLDYLAKTDQVAYAKLVVSILPKDVLVSVQERIPGELDAKDWALMLRVLDTIKQNVPSEANAGPQEVFGVIEDALRIHFAKSKTEILIEG